jgi:hypothetical protein
MNPLGIMSALQKIGKPSDSPRASVIFVHGLGGDPFATWQVGADRSTYWPAWLSADLPEFALYSLEYDAAPTKWTGSSMALPDRATNILNVLVAEQCDKVPILFICHSLGGLVVKQLLRIASDQIGSQFGKVLEQTEGVIFFATPSSGSNVASWVDKLRVIVQPTPATTDLQPDSAYLRDLDYWYRDHAPRDNIATEVFVETQKTKGVTIVDMTSGDPGIPGVRPIPIDASHIDICKIKSPDDALYKSVLRFIRDRIPTPKLPAAPVGELDRSRRIFISYRRSAKADARLADFLRHELQRAGHHVFIDVGMTVGVEWGKEIARRIEGCQFLIVLLSEESAASEMMQEEVRLAHERRKKDNTPVILPIRVQYDGQLAYPLGAYLNPLQHVFWKGPTDDAHSLEQVLTAIAGVDAGSLQLSSTAQNIPTYRDSVPAVSTATVQDQIVRRPQSVADPRVLRQPGGVLRLDDPCYIERQADGIVIPAASDVGVTSVIVAPRQMGKSSLLLRYLQKCRAADKKIIFVDFQLFSDEELASQQSLLSKLAERALREVGIDPKAMRSIQGPSDLTDFFEDVVFKATPAQITLALDEVDRIINKPYQSNFFAMLRGWHGRRAIEGPGWERLDLALVVSTEPQFYIDDETQSPFNVVEPVRPEPFKESHLKRLNELFGDPLQDSEVRKLLDLTEGQPYLTRLAFYRLRPGSGMTFVDLHEHASDDDGPFGEHLRAKLSQLSRRPELSKAMARLVSSGTQMDAALVYRLSAAGLVRRQRDGKIVAANEIYKNFLQRALA